MGRCKAGMRMWKQRELEVRRSVCTFEVALEWKAWKGWEMDVPVWWNTSVELVVVVSTD